MGCEGRTHRLAPGLLPPGGSRHQEKDSLEEELVDGQLGEDLELLPSPSLLSKPIPLPGVGWGALPSSGVGEHYHLLGWGLASIPKTRVPLNQGSSLSIT